MSTTTTAVNNALPQAQQESLFKPVGKKELNQNDFMNLLIKQLQYQDPTKPMDTYQMASQLAQFSSMQATLKMSDSMDQLLNYQTSQNNLQLLGLMGDQVEVKGNTLGVTGGATGGGEFILPENADTCTVEIYDAGGRLVQMKDLGSLPAGTYPMEWDGKDALGDTVADGGYSYKVKAFNLQGKELTVDTRVKGTVTGVTFDSGKAMLQLDKYAGADVGSVVSVLKNAS